MITIRDYFTEKHIILAFNQWTSTTVKIECIKNTAPLLSNKEHANFFPILMIDWAVNPKDSVILVGVDISKDLISDGHIINP